MGEEDFFASDNCSMSKLIMKVKRFSYVDVTLYIGDDSLVCCFVKFKNELHCCFEILMLLSHAKY